MAIPDIMFHQPRRAFRSPLGRASGVPRRITSFVAREDDIAGVTAALGDGPLVTLTGVGGVGKTRLALEVASRMEEQFDDGACFCELAPLDDGSAVGHAVAAALRLQQQQGLGIEATVIEFLRTHKMLLLVDNCEHVLPAAARLVDDIVRHCPDVVVLATSREALGVEGERILPVAPLPVEDATELFAERAKAGRPDFDLDHEPVGAVAEICRRLDGLPLAIELAAARMRDVVPIPLDGTFDDEPRLRHREESGMNRPGKSLAKSALAEDVETDRSLRAIPNRAACAAARN